MKQVFSAHRLCEQDGPLGPYIESYEAEMRGEGYAQQTREVQTRLVADFGCWLAKCGIQAQNITAELFRPYLRARARRRRPTRNDLSALQRLLELLRRQEVVAAAALPADYTGGAIAERISSLLATGACARYYNTGGIHGVRQRVSDGALWCQTSRPISAMCRGHYAIRAAACQHHSEQAGSVDDDGAEIVSTIRAVSGRHRNGSCRLHTGGGQLEAVDPASCPSARPGRPGIELGGPENGPWPPRLRDSPDPGTSGLARR